MSEETKVDFKFSQITKLLRMASVKPIYFIIPMFLGLIAAFFEGISVILLVPLAKGILGGDFTFVYKMPILKAIIAAFPGLFEGSNSPVFIMLLLMVFIATLIKNASQYISSINIAYQVRKFSNNLRKLIFQRYLSFGMLFIDRVNKGYLQNMLIDFSGQISSQLIGLNRAFSWIFVLVIYLAIMFFISWKLTIFTLIIFPVFAFSMNWLIEKTKRTSKANAERHNDLSRKVFNILSCIPLVKLYTAEKREEGDFNHISSAIEELEYSIDKKQMLMEPAQDMIALIIVLFLISGAAWVVVKEKLTDVSRLLVYFYIAKRLAGTVSLLNYVRCYMVTAFGPVTNIIKVFNDEDKFFTVGGKKELTGLKQGIELKGLTFSYRPNVKVLEDITFFIEKNKMTALVGPTGSGKTSIVNLILHFYDSPAGAVKIDGIDISEFTLKSLRAHMAFVSQDTLLFNDTLKANITYGLERKVSDEELIDIVKKARLYDFIMKLPERLNTYIGDRGIMLSGGEKQRVSIARALLKGAEILILDEATSALDTQTEKLIQEAMDEVIAGKTVIVIAHRLSTIKNADKIVVIENGRFIEEGRLDELLQKKGKFYQYWEAQKFY